MEEEEHEGGHSSPPIVDRMQDWEENLQYQENILHAHRTAPEVLPRLHRLRPSQPPSCSNSPHRISLPSIQR